MAMIRNAVKIIKLRKLEKDLMAIEKMAENNGWEKRQAAKNELFRLIVAQKDLKKLLDKFGKTETDLSVIYENLCNCAGEPVKKRIFVPVEALAYRHSLKYVLENADDLCNSQERREIIGRVLTTYFKRNDILEVSEKRYLQEEVFEANLRKKRSTRRAELDKKIQEREAGKAAKTA